MCFQGYHGQLGSGLVSVSCTTDETSEMIKLHPIRAPVLYC